MKIDNDLIQKLMNLGVSNRYAQVRELAKHNDPKVILALTERWEIEAKISLALVSTLRMAAYERRNRTEYKNNILATLLTLSDELEIRNEPNENLKWKNPIKVTKREDANPEKNSHKLRLTIDEVSDEDLLTLQPIISLKKNLFLSAAKNTSTNLRIDSDTTIQGTTSCWQSNDNETFNYFPLNCSVVKTESNSFKDIGSREHLMDVVLTEILKYQKTPKPIQLKHQDYVITSGSCFAQEMKTALRKNGLNAESLRIDESINTIYANLELLKSINSQKPTEKLKHIFSEDARERLANLHALISTAKLFILTVGVAPVVIERSTGEMTLAKTTATEFQKKSLMLEMSTVEENVDALRSYSALLKTINPGITTVISLSPVPLIGYTNDYSVIERDVLSKSILKLAIDNFMRSPEADNVYYWPSFEAIKWIPAHITNEINYRTFGHPDNNARHVSRWAVEVVTKKFIEKFIETV
jgi:GSCFA family